MADSNLLCKQIAENTLILENIIGYLDLKDLYHFRHVCHTWKELADVVIRKIAEREIYSGEENWVEELKSDIQYFAFLNLCNLRFRWAEQTTENLIIAIHLQKVGNLIKVLKIWDIRLKTEGNVIALETILTSMSNLQKVKLQFEEINAPIFLNFAPNLSCEIVKINLSRLKAGPENAEIIYFQALKVFGDPISNFDHPGLDHYLFDDLANRNSPMLSLRKMRLIGYSNMTLMGIVTFPETVNPAILPNLKKLFVEIKVPSESFANSLQRFLKSFSKNLETVSLLCPTRFGSDFEFNNEPVTLPVPSLPKLRKLTLGIPPVFDGQPVFLWDLGKQLAKDFTILEEMKFQIKRWNDTSGLKPSWEDYKYPEAWCIWEAIVPIFGKEIVDLRPFKAMRKVDFCLPPDWFSYKENIPWAKSFLEVCYKLYPVVNKYRNEQVEMLEILAGIRKSENEK